MAYIQLFCLLLLRLLKLSFISAVVVFKSKYNLFELYLKKSIKFSLTQLTHEAGNAKVESSK